MVEVEVEVAGDVESVLLSVVVMVIDVGRVEEELLPVDETTDVVDVATEDVEVEVVV